MLPAPAFRHPIATRVAGGTMRARSLTIVLLATVATFSVAARATADLAAQNLGPYGGPSGTAFTRTCGPDRVMTGFRARSGLALDAIGLFCRPVGADGQLGSEEAVGALAGGTGGTASAARCPAGSVAAGATVYHTTLVTVGLTITCRNWIASSRRFGTSTTTRLAVGVVAATTGLVSARGAMCAEDVQPIRSLRGRAGSVVDALGVTCDEP
jgi:hypothetical protein